MWHFCKIDTNSVCVEAFYPSNTYANLKKSSLFNQYFQRARNANGEIYVCICKQGFWVGDRRLPKGTSRWRPQIFLPLLHKIKRKLLLLLKAQNFNESTNKQNVKEFIIISFNRSKDWAEATDISHFWSYVARQTHALIHGVMFANFPNASLSGTLDSCSLPTAHARAQKWLVDKCMNKTLG